MAIVQSIMASLGAAPAGPPPPTILPDPGGWFNSVANGSNNTLKLKVYDQYNFDSTDLSSMTLLQTTAAYPFLTTGENYRTYMYTGYVYVPAGANYIFRTVSDDGSYLWLGTYAWDGNYTINNALINNGGLHGSTQVDSLQITLVGNQWYPIRVLFGNMEGGTALQIYYSTDNNIWDNPTYSYNTATAEGFS